ncbi:hypothetical protein ACWELJ_08695 [Nocardia sp. NPDC004582]
MKPKPLARTTFCIAATAAVASVGLGAAPASADITNLTVACVRSYGTYEPCEASEIGMHVTDLTPVWITVNGTALAGSPFLPRQDNYGIHLNLTLDCRMTPLHVVAMQKSASGTITSQQSADLSPDYTVGNLVIGHLTGSSAGGSSAAVNDANTGSAESAGCHVKSQY